MGSRDVFCVRIYCQKVTQPRADLTAAPGAVMEGARVSERAPFHNSITLDTFAASSEGAREATGREVVLIESARALTPEQL